MDKKRFYINTKGNDDEAYREAMDFACKLSNESPSIKRIILLIHTKQNTGWFERLFGSEVVKKLFNGTHFKNCSPIFKFETKKTYDDLFEASDIVISCGLDSEDLLKIDDFYSVQAIIAIPWLPEKLQKWVQTWNPVEIRGNQESVVSYPEPSCIVIKALEELTNDINMSTGIINPFDNEQAKTYILALHKYESSLDENIVGAYLIRCLGWETQHAKDIEALIKTLNSGRHFKGGNRTSLQHYYKAWQEKCTE